MSAEDAAILAAMRRRVEAALRERGVAFGDAHLLTGAAVRELLAVVDTLSRREVARAAAAARIDALSGRSAESR